MPKETLKIEKLQFRTIRHEIGNWQGATMPRTNSAPLSLYQNRATDSENLIYRMSTNSNNSLRNASKSVQLDPS